MCVGEQEDFLCVVSCRCVTTLNLAVAYEIYVLYCIQAYVCVCQQEKLQSVMLESKELSNDINNRKQMLVKIEEEIQHAEEVCQ